METVEYSPIGKQDLKRGRSTFQVTLPDGTTDTLDELNLDSFDKLLSEEDASNDSATNVLTLRHTTSGTPGDGIGVKQTFQNESDDEDPSDAGAVEFTHDDVSAGSEDTSFYIWLRRAGNALSRALRLVVNGNFLLTFSTTLTANRTLTLPDADDTIVGRATTDTLTNKTFSDPSMNVGGASTGSIKGSGIADAQITSAATTAVTVEEDLQTYTLPADALDANKRMIRVTAWGSFAANGNTKTLRLYFGATSVITNLDTTAPNNNPWRITALIIRSGSNAQLASADMVVGSTQQSVGQTTPAETDSGTVVIKITGQNGTANANDIVCQGMITEFLN